MHTTQGSMPGSGSAILGRRLSGGEVLIADEVVGVRCAWNDLRTGDGEDVRVEWTLRVACVDSPADRQMLAERFLVSPQSTLTAAGAGSYFTETIATALRRKVAELPVDALLRGERDLVLVDLLTAEARRAAFAVGMTVLPPFSLHLESPSRERAQRLAEAREKLASLTSISAARATAIAELTNALTSNAGDRQRNAQVLTDLKLANPQDLLRAVALSDPAWSEAQPALWVVAGTRLLRVDPTRPHVTVSNSIELDSLGPLRSVRAAEVDGAAALLVGARSGVHVVDAANRQVIRTLRHEGASDFGFNSACWLPSCSCVVASHSEYGLLAWRLNAASDAAPQHWPAKGARGVVPTVEDRAAVVIDGVVNMFSPDTGLQPCGIEAAALAALGTGELIAVDESGTITLLSPGELACGSNAGIRLHGPGAVATALDVCGVPRALVADAKSNTLRLLDFAGGDPISVGPPNLAVRELRARPGFIAATNLDRTRLHLIDLARPDVVAAELNVAALLGNRVADCCFG